LAPLMRTTVMFVGDVDCGGNLEVAGGFLARSGASGGNAEFCLRAKREGKIAGREIQTCEGKEECIADLFAFVLRQLRGGEDSARRGIRAMIWMTQWLSRMDLRRFL
jgi:hypothetical protein